MLDVIKNPSAAQRSQTGNKIKNPQPRERDADLLLHQTNHMKKKFN